MSIAVCHCHCAWTALLTAVNKALSIHQPLCSRCNDSFFFTAVYVTTVRVMPKIPICAQMWNGLKRLSFAKVWYMCFDKVSARRAVCEPITAFFVYLFFTSLVSKVGCLCGLLGHQHHKLTFVATVQVNYYLNQKIISGSQHTSASTCGGSWDKSRESTKKSSKIKKIK